MWKLTIALTLVTGVMVGVYAGLLISQRQVEKTAITHNCGQYNPKTAAFEWVEPVPTISLSQLSEPLPVPSPQHKPKVKK